MGAYTVLHVVCESTPDWVPDREFLEDILTYIGATAVRAMSGWSRPLSPWSSDDPGEQGLLFDEYQLNLDIPSALSTWEERRALLTWMTVTSDWGRRFYESLRSIPEEVSDQCYPTDTSLSIGPSEIASQYEDQSQGWFCSQLQMGGFRVPKDWDTYLSLIREDHVFRELLEYLRGISGKEWSVLMSASV